MKYFIRSVKYFIYFWVIMAMVIGLLVLIGAVEPNIETMFQGGYNALWKIAIIFAIISAIYPKVSFIQRAASFPGSWEENKKDIRKYMEDKGFVFEKEEKDSMSFRHKGLINRLFKMFEDRIVIRPVFGGVTVDGHRRDAISIATGIEYTLAKDLAEESDTPDEQ